MLRTAVFRRYSLAFALPCSVLPAVGQTTKQVTTIPQTLQGSSTQAQEATAQLAALQWSSSYSGGYPQGFWVLYNGAWYQSLTFGNTTTPGASGTQWVSGVPTAAQIQNSLGGQTGCSTAGYVYVPASNTCVATATASAVQANATAITNEVQRATTAETSIGVTGSGTPTLTPSAPYQQYRDVTATPGSDLWLASPHMLYWQNAKTGVISPVASVGLLKVDPISGVAGLDDYELNETTGTTLADQWTSANALTLSQSTPVLNGGNGLSYATQGNNSYVVLPTAEANNAYTYEICSTLPVQYSQPVLFGGTVSSGNPSSFLYDHTNTPSFSQYSQLVSQNVEVGTPLRPAGDGCLMLEMNGANGSMQFFEGTYKVPMTANGSGTYSFANINNFYLGNQDATAQKAFQGKIYKFRVFNGTPSDEYVKYMQAYSRQQLLTAGVTLGADGPQVASSSSPLIYMPGDSITAGIGSFANQYGGDPGYLQISLPTATIINAGVGSAQLCSGTGAGNITLNTQTVGPAIKALAPSIQNSAVIMLAGTNDIGSNKTSTAILACELTALNTLKSQGWSKVIAETLLQRNPIAIGATSVANLNAFNSALLSSGYADDVLDVSSSPIFQYPIQNQQFYYFDGVHLQDPGYQAKAAMERSELNKLGVTAGLPAITDAFSATPNFDMSKSTHHTLPLTGTVTYFTVSGIIPGMRFSIDFEQPATGTTYAVPYPSTTTGSGATATATLNGSSITMTLGNGGNGFYKAAFMPIFVPNSTFTCTGSTGRWVPSLSSGNISALAGTGTGTVTASGCSGGSSNAVIVSSTEPVWQNAANITMPSASDAVGTVRRLVCDVDATATNITCSN